MTETSSTNLDLEFKLHEAENDRLFFWREEGVEDPDSLTQDHKRLIFKVPLLLYADKLEPNQQYPGARYEHGAEFSGLGFCPKTAAEVRMVTAKDEDDIFATHGPDERLRRAANTKKGEPNKAQKSTFETIEGFVGDAIADRARLMVARIPSGREIISDINIVRSDIDLLNTIADHLHGLEILEHGLDLDKHTTKFKQRQQYWRGFMQAAVQPGFAEDTQLLAIYNTVRESARRRAEYWGKQKEAAYKKVGGVLVDDVQETVIPVRSEDNPTEEPERPETADVYPWRENQIPGMEEVPVLKQGVEEVMPPKSKPKQVLPEPLFDTNPLKKPDQKKAQRPKRGPIRYKSPRDKGAPKKLAQEIRYYRGETDQLPE